MGYKKVTIGGDPKLRAEILDMGQAVLDERNNPGHCQHPVLGPSVGHWDTTGSKVPPFDLHNCKECGTSKAVLPFKFQQLM